MDSVLAAALISSAASIAVVALGQRFYRRNGLPTDIDIRLINELKDLNQALEKNNERLESEISELNQAKVDCAFRIEELEKDVDRLQRQVVRLMSTGNGK